MKPLCWFHCFIFFSVCRGKNSRLSHGHNFHSFFQLDFGPCRFARVQKVCLKHQRVATSRGDFRIFSAVWRNNHVLWLADTLEIWWTLCIHDHPFTCELCWEQYLLCASLGVARRSELRAIPNSPFSSRQRLKHTQKAVIKCFAESMHESAERPSTVLARLCSARFAQDFPARKFCCWWTS